MVRCIMIMEMPWPTLVFIAVVMAVAVVVFDRTAPESRMTVGFHRFQRHGVMRGRSERRREADRDHHGDREQDLHSPKEWSEERL